MRKVLLGVLAILLLSAPGWAAPFLVCDPQAGVEWYIILADGQPEIKTNAIQDGSIKYDLGSVPEGSHLWNVKACNVWGCSEASPFSFTKLFPGSLQNIRIVE